MFCSEFAGAWCVTRRCAVLPGVHSMQITHSSRKSTSCCSCGSSSTACSSCLTWTYGRFHASCSTWTNESAGIRLTNAESRSLFFHGSCTVNEHLGRTRSTLPWLYIFNPRAQALTDRRGCLLSRVCFASADGLPGLQLFYSLHTASSGHECFNKWIF